jgi:hypothetical protein
MSETQEEGLQDDPELHPAFEEGIQVPENEIRYEYECYYAYREQVGADRVPKDVSLKDPHDVVGEVRGPDPPDRIGK